MKKTLSLFTSLIMMISLISVLPAITAGAETSEDMHSEIAQA